MKTCAFGNVEEFYAPVMAGFDGSTREKWASECSSISPLALFWGAADGLVFLPCETGEDFLEYVTNNLGFRGLRVVVPCGKASLSRSILNDSASFDMLVKAVREGARLLSWGESGEYLELLKELSRGFQKLSREPVEAGALWKTGYLGSKSGFRHFCAGRGLPMPEGRVASTLSLAAGLAAEFLGRGEGAALKADYGVGGKCQLLIPSSGARFTSGRRKGIAGMARWVPELKSGAVVVEKLIEGGSSASVQGECDGLGGFAVHYLAAHLEKHLSGEGALIGNGAFESPVIEERVRGLGALAGRRASAFGFMGVCGFDVVLDSGGFPFLLEMNPRRTTTTHGFRLGNLLLGAGWEKDHSVAVAQDIPCAAAFPDAKKALDGLLFPVEGNREGVVITAPPVNGKGSFAALAGDAKTAEKLLIETKERLG